MKLFCDPSFIVSLIFKDPRWEQIAAAVGAHDQPVLSDFGYGEAVSAIALRVRRERLPADAGVTLIERLDSFLRAWTCIEIASADVSRATGFVARMDLSLRLADAIHIATAERIGSTLLTADRQQFRAALRLGVAVLNPLLS